MSGLTTYIRVDGVPQPSLAGLLRAAKRLRTEKYGLEVIADEAIFHLQGLSEKCEDHQLVIKSAREIREAMQVAKSNDAKIPLQFRSAMEICSKHWIQVNPLISSGFGARSVAVLNAYNTALAAKNPEAMRAAHEDAGIVATLYHISAILGEDLSHTLLAGSALIGDSNYIGTFDPKGTLLHLECAGAYNVNVIVQIFTKSCIDPLVIVGEAKGGSSRLGKVNGPKAITMKSGVLIPISQGEINYALSRAHYMQNDAGDSLEGKARLAAGAAIQAAEKSKCLVYTVVRGSCYNQTFKHKRKAITCL